jgi:hypothetical protein
VIRLFAIGFQNRTIAERNCAMKTPRIPQDTPELDMEQRKQAIAYQLWEDEGRPEGKAEEHWQQACLVVMSLTDEETTASPIWLKRDDRPAAEQTAPSESKRTPARHAA